METPQLLGKVTLEESDETRHLQSARCLHKEVEMITHENESVDEHGVFRLRSTEDSEEEVVDLSRGSQ